MQLGVTHGTGLKEALPDDVRRLFGQPAVLVPFVAQIDGQETCNETVSSAGDALERAYA